MPGGSRSAVGPVNDKRLAELIEPVIAASGMDLESLRMSVAGKRRLLRIVVDGDHGVSLDDAADVSRAVSAMLDPKIVVPAIGFAISNLFAQVLDDPRAFGNVGPCKPP